MGQHGSNGDQQHWPDDEAHGYTGHPDGRGNAGNAGYDDNNGRHRHTYYPSGSFTGPPGQIQAPAPVYHPNQIAFYQNSAYHGQAQWVAPSGPYWQTPYTILAPAASYNPTQYAQPNPIYVGNGVYGALPASEPAKPATPSPHVWFGRNKAQVDEDNMKIANSEGAWDKREVAPVGLKSDQVIWVVESDGQYTLRTFATVQELKGTWKQDPRFEAAWYFVREE